MITATAIKLYEVDKGHLPERIDELVPDYVSRSFTEDPFNKFDFLKYKKTHTGFLLYSFGPDKKDDSGRIDYDGETNLKGDIVFST